MRGLALALLLLVPFAAAQNQSTDELPTGNETVDVDESVESGPGLAYGAFVLIGTVAFAAAFAYAAYKYTRRPPSAP